jgi:glycosyltransferase involved in cell wall biosynthesis
MTYSFVVPIYNDAYLAEAFCKEFQRVFRGYLEKNDIENEVELLFVNDGSKNDSWNVLANLSKSFNFIKLIDLSRNFGQHIALSCGYEQAKGEYVGMLNVDMQDPPAEIPKMLDILKNEDIDFVMGLREVRYSSFLDKTTSRLFNWVLNKATSQNMPINASTLRVMNRKFVDAFNQLNEKKRFIPALENWLGFKHKYIQISHQARIDNKSSYNFRKRLEMASDAVIAFSDLPLKFTILGGFFVSFISICLIFLIIISKLFFKEFLPGYVSIVSIITFFFGIQMIVIGIMGLYIGKIWYQVQDRPIYLIREKVNF